MYFTYLFVPLHPECVPMEQYQIDLKALTAEETLFRYALDNQFFAALDGAQISKGQLEDQLVIRKQAGAFECRLQVEGTVQIPCDLCLDEMDQPISAQSRLVVKLGEAYSEADDELLIIDEADGTFDVSWLIYEQIALAIPIKHIHAPGKCNRAMTEKLTELSAARSSDGDQPIDPRWEALKKLKM